MTTDTLLLILTGLCAFLAAAVVWLVLEMRLLKIQTSENLRRDEQDEMIEAILTGVRSERQEVQQAVLNVERGVSQTLAGLTGYLTEQQNRSAAEVRTLNETARQSLAETREVMNRQLLELQGLVDARFAKIIETNASASEALGAKLESKFSEIRRPASRRCVRRFRKSSIARSPSALRRASGPWTRSSASCRRGWARCVRWPRASGTSRASSQT